MGRDGEGCGEMGRDGERWGEIVRQREVGKGSALTEKVHTTKYLFLTYNIVYVVLQLANIAHHLRTVLYFKTMQVGTLSENNGAFFFNSRPEHCY